tara:strand:+ start:312 stop:425 length:114 start_codon:yes stop_codon:yes gene_type:complete
MKSNSDEARPMVLDLVKIYETENNSKNSLNIQTTYNL